MSKFLVKGDKMVNISKVDSVNFTLKEKYIRVRLWFGDSDSIFEYNLEEAKTLIKKVEDSSAKESVYVSVLNTLNPGPFDLNKEPKKFNVGENSSLADLYEAFKEAFGIQMQELCK